MAESYHLLLELLSSEPFVQECFQVIENMCLSREISFTVQGSQPSVDFKAFVNKYYFNFLKSAIRQAHGLGIDLEFMSYPQQTEAGRAMREAIVNDVRPFSRRRMLAALRERRQHETRLKAEC